MKKTFKWILFSTLILSICAVIAMLAIYLPQYIRCANYSTSEGYSNFICYDDDSIEIVKNEELGAVPYTFNVRLYNLSDKEQTLTFRFWFTCTDSEGQYYDYVDKEITIPSSTNHLDIASRDYFAGSIDYSCDLYQFSSCLNVEYGAMVSDKYISNINTNSPGDIWIDGVLINTVGFRNIDGFDITTNQDMCESLENNKDLLYLTDLDLNLVHSDWQGAFTGVIISLSCAGAVLLLSLIFTIVLLLPNKKQLNKKEQNSK